LRDTVFQPVQTRSMSVAVNTATTPSVAAASAVSVISKLACAKGLRRKAAWSSPLMVTSST
jgi:hypothetical protein